MRNQNPLILNSSGCDVRSSPKAGGNSESRSAAGPVQPAAQFASHGMFAMESEGVERVVTLDDAIHSLPHQPHQGLPPLAEHGRPHAHLHFPDEDEG